MSADLGGAAWAPATHYYVLLNRSDDGRFAIHENLVFHSGAGTTLEMRVFCRTDLEKHLANAGFADINIFSKDVLEWGILHKRPWSLPILARRPPAIPSNG
jgi:hypothetical protein